MDNHRTRREQFTFYRSYYEALKALPKREQVNVFLAICAYALDEETPNLSGVALSVFTLIRPTLDSGRNKAMNRMNKTAKCEKETGNKHGTNEEQNDNKKEQTGKEKEGEGEGEGEGEREYERENDSSSLPPVPPSRGAPDSARKEKPKKPREEDWGFGPELTEAFRAWLRYKAEKRQPYQPEGLRALVTETRHNAERYGEAAVAALIRKCMSANWQGIIWDRLPKMAEDNSWIKKSIQARDGKGAWDYVNDH